ncbi:MAG: hypothetical protein Q4C98_08900 [Capnocytophaga sp.]|nr:hypothetical protein [Capnocytophaga sp.]
MENLQPKDSLAIIEAVISERKKKYEENGFLFIFWGILVILAGILQFLMLWLDFQPKMSGLVWAILMPLGFIYTFIVKMKEDKNAQKKGKTTDWAGYLWLVTGIIAMFGGFFQTHANTTLLMIYIPMTIASLSTALQLKNRLWVTTSTIAIPLIYSSLYIDYGYFSPLVSSVLAFLIFLLPGFQLYTDFKKRNNV